MEITNCNDFFFDLGCHFINPRSCKEETLMRLSLKLRTSILHSLFYLKAKILPCICIKPHCSIIHFDKKFKEKKEQKRDDLIVAATMNVVKSMSILKTSSLHQSITPTLLNRLRLKVFQCLNIHFNSISFVWFHA